MGKQSNLQLKSDPLFADWSGERGTVSTGQTLILSVPWTVRYLAGFWHSWSSNHPEQVRERQRCARHVWQNGRTTRAGLGWVVHGLVSSEVWDRQGVDADWGMGTPCWGAANAETVRVRTEKAASVLVAPGMLPSLWVCVHTLVASQTSRGKSQMLPGEYCSIQIPTSPFGLCFLWEGNPGVWAGRQAQHTPASPQQVTEPVADGTHS